MDFLYVFLYFIQTCDSLTNEMNKYLEKLNNVAACCHWGLVIVGAYFVLTFLSVGSTCAMGIYYIYIMDKFKVNLTSATVIGALNTAVGHSGAIIAMPFVEKFGERPVMILGGILNLIGYSVSTFVTSFPLLYATMGIIPGLGISFSRVSIVIAVNRYFQKAKMLSVSFGVVGASVGMLSFPLLIRFLAELYGLNGALLIHAGLCFNIVACGATIFPSKRKQLKKEKSDEEKTLTCGNKQTVGFSFCVQPPFIGYMFTNFLFMAALYIPTTQIPKHAVSIGISVKDISLAIAVSGIGNMFGRISFGVLSHRYESHVVKLWIICLTCSGLIMLMVPFSTKVEEFMIFMIIYGYFEGASSVGWNISLFNLINIKYYERGISVAYFVAGIGLAVGSPFTAFLSEEFSSNGISYYIGCGMFVLGAFIMIPFASISANTDNVFHASKKPNEPISTVYGSC
ncbi:monocarboxylate transporter 9-like [Mytilus trossulus]|uniref:monocarboxylate transporter 9-like n=1 Tax=Mytilus trossulus TaxID=6551 RepID=UPI0030077F32